MAKKKGRAPDFMLHVKVRNDLADRASKVGATWKSVGTDGRERISIALDPYVVLSQKDDIILTLFERGKYESPYDVSGEGDNGDQ